jgi:uncharacterized membrane protein (Fun14 family)
MQMHPAYAVLDPFLIWFYRITGYAFVDFVVGTFILSMIAVIIGEFTISLAFLANRKFIEKNTDDVVRYQNISVDAIESGNKSAYKAANKVANDAFGRSFFQQIALSTAFLWPIPFALGWMSCRFADLEFGLLFTDHTVGYACVFFPLYIGAYLLFKRFKCKIPYFKWIDSILDSSANRHKEMRSFADLLPSKRKSDIGSRE